MPYTAYRTLLGISLHRRCNIISQTFQTLHGECLDSCSFWYWFRAATSQSRPLGKLITHCPPCELCRGLDAGRMRSLERAPVYSALPNTIVDGARPLAQWRRSGPFWPTSGCDDARRRVFAFGFVREPPRYPHQVAWHHSQMRWAEPRRCDYFGVAAPSPSGFVNINNEVIAGIMRSVFVKGYAHHLARPQPFSEPYIVFYLQVFTANYNANVVFRRCPQ